MQTIEYFAVKPVTILGRQYAPGAKIHDPNIKPGVLATLLNTKRIGTRVTHLAPEGNAEPEAVATEQVPASTEQVPAAEEPRVEGPSDLLEAWRTKYGFADTDMSFRHWLYKQAGDRGIKSNGSNEEIVARLQAAGITPEATDGTDG